VRALPARQTALWPRQQQPLQAGAASRCINAAASGYAAPSCRVLPPKRGLCRTTPLAFKMNSSLQCWWGCSRAGRWLARVGRPDKGVGCGINDAFVKCSVPFAWFVAGQGNVVRLRSDVHTHACALATHGLSSQWASTFGYLCCGSWCGCAAALMCASVCEPHLRS
jgi:hypothetical protein